MTTDHSSATPAENAQEALAVKVIAEQTAMLSNLAYANLIANVNLAQQNALSNQQALNELQVAVLGKVVNLVSNLSPMEAVSASKLLTGNDVAEALADLKAALAAFSPAPAPAANSALAGQPSGNHDKEGVNG